jgi:adenosylcobinamide-GDP ribazoletransferase
MIKKEIKVLLAAIRFYTRIPVPPETDFSNEMLHKSTRYFPFVGLVVGGTGAFLFWLLNLILPFPVAIIISMATTIMVTGAFHEDAFADFCDGFGGGYTRERILEIMKDSRIGAYGATGIILMLLSKFVCLSSMRASDIPLVLISGHALSRFLPVCMIYTAAYVREDSLSKSRPIGRKGSGISFWVAAFFGTIALVFIPWKPILLILVLSLFVFLVFSWYTRRKIGGYTGDVLGALQQLAEISFYLGFLIYKYNLA